MDTGNNEAGAEAGNDGYLAQIEAEQSAAEAQDGQGADAAGSAPGAEAGSEAGAEGQAQPEALPPLSVEEYQKRHQQITSALRESRGSEREFKRQLGEMKAQLEAFQQSQPQQFERFQIERQLAEYQTIDWQAWRQQDPAAAQAAANEVLALSNRYETIQQEDQQRQQQAQAQAQQQQFQHLATTLQEQETAIRQAKPDYDKAVEFLKAEIVREANAQGYFGDQAQQYLNQTLVQVGARVNQSGQDMAEFAYNRAVELGYSAPAPDLASIKAGEAASKTISNLGPKSEASTESFEEKMGQLSGAAARNFWAQARKQAGV